MRKDCKTFTAIINGIDQIITKKINQQTQKITTSNIGDGEEELINKESKEQIIKNSIEIWKNSSKMINRLAKENGIYYFHFLQPNQYLPNSKPLTDDEKKSAINEVNKEIYSIDKSYPIMQDEIIELKKDGVNATDLTMLFKDENKPVYKDICCHFNEYGNNVLAKSIGKTIQEIFAKNKLTFQ